jgi:hypothetical protein
MDTPSGRAQKDAISVTLSLRVFLADRVKGSDRTPGTEASTHSHQFQMT